jgi:hypothetical protein
MPDEAVVAIARIPLARSMRRLLVVPLLLLGLAAVAAGAGVLLLPAWQSFALLAAAGAGVLLALYIVAVVSTVRLDVEVSTLRLRWIGTDRRYTLARGAVTRVPLAGERAAKLRPRLGAFGWGLGRARLRGEETIQLVRLARSRAVILVPTDAGRVGVAPRSEEQFLEALGAAARVQQRLDQVAARARAIPLARVPEVVRAAAPPVPEAPPEPQRPMTGIERTLLEERLAAERAAALAAAAAERRAAERVAAATAAAAVPPGSRSVTAATSARRVSVPRPALPRPGLPRVSLNRPRISAPRGIGRPQAMSMLGAAIPLLAAGGVWLAGYVTGAFDRPAGDAERLSIGLVLSGPAAALAALAARAWFPRLVGLVIVSALCALVLVGRALLV